MNIQSVSCVCEYEYGYECEYAVVVTISYHFVPNLTHQIEFSIDIVQLVLHTKINK